MEQIFEQTKLYEDIAEKKSFNYDLLIKALDWIGSFIKKNNYILYGGMAIDLALKEAGHPGIYGPDSIPDYDFMCADFYTVSNEIAKNLHEQGFENVTAINALHLTSRRVRIDFVPVADITYVPKNLLETIPFITTKYGFKVVHPDFQRIDMLRSFNTMMCFPPMETIMHRTSKDLRRFKMLAANYPIKYDAQKIPAPGKQKITVIRGTALGGEAVYPILWYIMNNLLTEKNWVGKIISEKNTPGVTLEFLCERFNKLPKCKGVVPVDVSKLELPVESVTLYTDNIDAHSKTLKNKEYHEKYMDDLIFRYVKSDTTELLDCWGTGVPVFNLKTCGEFLHIPLPDIEVTQPTAALQYLLQRSFYYPEKKNYYRYLYNCVSELIDIAESIITNGFIGDFVDFDGKFPFTFTLRNYTDKLYGLDYQFMLTNTFGEKN